MKETKINISAFQVSESLSFSVGVTFEAALDMHKWRAGRALGCGRGGWRGSNPPSSIFPNTYRGGLGASGHVLWQQPGGVMQKKIMVWIIRIFLEMQILCWEAMFPGTLAMVGGSVVPLILYILVIPLLSTVLEAVLFIAANFLSFLFLLFPHYAVIVNISSSVDVNQSAPSSLYSLWGWNLPPASLLKSHGWYGNVWVFPSQAQALCTYLREGLLIHSALCLSSSIPFSSSSPELRKCECLHTGHDLSYPSLSGWSLNKSHGNKHSFEQSISCLSLNSTAGKSWGSISILGTASLTHHTVLRAHPCCSTRRDVLPF